MDTLVAETELNKDLRIINNSFTYFALRVQAAERIKASHRALATNLAEAQDMNKLQLEHIAELEKQLAAVTEERDLLRTIIINAVGILNPYVDGITQLIRASTHVTQKFEAVKEVLKAKWPKSTPILNAHDASPDQ